MASTQDFILLAISLLGLLMIVGGIYFLMGPGAASDAKYEDEEDQDEVDERVRRAANAAAARAGGRRRRGGRRGGAAEAEENEAEAEGEPVARGGGGGGDDSGDDDDGASGQEGDEDRYMTKKEMRKLEKKQQKEEERQMREAMIKERAEKNKARDEADRKRREKEREREKLEEERERKASEAAAKKAAEELAAWQAEFCLEGEGEDGVGVEETQEMLQEFIDYIKRHKVVLLEELAATFKLRTHDTIDRVQRLEKDGRITGVVDDRGKFIYITPDEMDTVAKLVKKKGRMSLADFTRESNRLINLSVVVEPPAPTAQAAEEAKTG